MPRNSEVNYWPSRAGFYTTVKGKQELLAKGIDDSPDGPVYRLALAKFDELIFGSPQGPTLGEIVNKYLGWCDHNVAEATTKIRRGALKPILNSLGDKRIHDLIGFDIVQFCDEQRSKSAWSDGQVCLVTRTLQACLNWAVQVGLLKEHSLTSLKPPASGSRGLECVITPEQEEDVLCATRGPLRDFCTVLRDTGARPGEICKAEAKHYDPSIQALVFQSADRDRRQRHKTARTGRARVIYLVGQSAEIVARLFNLFPTGPLFRAPRPRKKGPMKGQRWAWTDSHLGNALQRLRRKVKVPHFIYYSFRHTFAVRWLRQGKPAIALCEVLGTSMKMLQRHYGHLAEQHDYLRRLVEDLHATRQEG